jgi:hypothetical protein
VRGRVALTILLTAAAVCTSAGVAAALPGDPGFEPLTPPDGAKLGVSTQGIQVTYTCPVYRQFSAGEGFTVFGGPDDYTAGFSRSPALGTDGRLREDGLVALDGGHESNRLPAGRCASTFAAGGSDRPQETPGTYYWQVWRICTGCAAGYEVGPVRMFVLRAKGKPSLRPPKRAFAGYPFAVSLALPGLVDGAPVRVQRRVGKGWRDAARTIVLGGKGEAVLVLRAGKTRLRVVAKAGDQLLTSTARKLTVAQPRRWSTSAADDGSYRGRPGGERSVRLRVTRGGREIRGFRAYVAMLCPGLTGGQLTTQIGTAATGRIKVAPDGSFLGVATPGRQTSIRARGTLSHGKVRKGRVELSVGECVGSVSYSARRGA